MGQDSIRAAVTRRLNRPQPDTTRLWTIQPPAVWHALRERGTLLVDPDHPDFHASVDDFREAYEWMREQMTLRIPCYAGHYPWWAYEHFLDLRFYRWHTPRHGENLVRLELAVPKEQVLLSGYAAWYWVLNRWYLPEAVDGEDYERQSEAWEKEAAGHGVDLNRHNPYAEPWETQMRTSGSTSSMPRRGTPRKQSRPPLSGWNSHRWSR